MIENWLATLYCFIILKRSRFYFLWCHSTNPAGRTSVHQTAARVTMNNNSNTGPALQFILHDYSQKLKREASEDGSLERQSKKLKRTHAKKACISCRKAHTACSDERPCTRCVKKGTECVDPPATEYDSPTNSSPETVKDVPEKIEPSANQFTFALNKNVTENNNTYAQAVQPVFNYPPQIVARQTSQNNMIVIDENQRYRIEQTLNENQFMRHEIQRLQNTNIQQEQLVAQLFSQIQDLQAITRHQQDMIQTFSKTHVEDSMQRHFERETQLDTTQRIAYPHHQTENRNQDQHPTWINLQTADGVAISMWDKTTLCMLGCNDAFCTKLGISQTRLRKKNIHLLDFKPAASVPYLEVLIYALINSGVKFIEVKAVFVNDANEEVYVKDRMHIENQIFWISHEVVDVIDDEYRFDEYHHVKTYEVPRDPTGAKKFMDMHPPNRKLVSFLDVLKVLEEKKKKHEQLTQQEFEDMTNPK